MEDKPGGILETANKGPDLAVHSNSPYFKAAAARQSTILLLRNKTTHHYNLVTSLATRSALQVY